ncbi:hypothetical protein EB796_005110 [Bugula neritina]|uniref:Uncharacterized protein n=1 Tax=Bugula neritina TaxID=10212 RepID=A0A7J7KGG0_BUGNE|nr:hypothetical protein EB796_005110 [Bugula neritina]
MRKEIIVDSSPWSRINQENRLSLILLELSHSAIRDATRCTQVEFQVAQVSGQVDRAINVMVVKTWLMTVTPAGLAPSVFVKSRLLLHSPTLKSKLLNDPSAEGQVKSQNTTSEGPKVVLIRNPVARPPMRRPGSQLDLLLEFIASQSEKL